MVRIRRAAGRPALLSLLAASVLLAACDNNESPFPTQSAGGSAGGGGGGTGTFQVSDPAGDLPASASEGAPDAVALTGSMRTDSLIVTIAFRSGISAWSMSRPNSLTGFIDLDIDEDPSTGIESAADEAGGNSGQGVDFYVSLEDVAPGQVELVDVASMVTYRIPANFTATAVTVRIPRVLLADFEPGFTISAVVGHPARSVTDFVPDAGSVRVTY